MSYSLQPLRRNNNLSLFSGNSELPIRIIFFSLDNHKLPVNSRTNLAPKNKEINLKDEVRAVGTVAPPAFGTQFDCQFAVLCLVLYQLLADRYYHARQGHFYLWLR